MTSVRIEPTTSRLDLPLLCRLSYEVGQRKLGTIKVEFNSHLELILCCGNEIEMKVDPRSYERSYCNVVTIYSSAMCDGKDPGWREHEELVVWADNKTRILWAWNSNYSYS